MSKQKKISYIRERCIEANPSIKDLVFGCEVRYYMDSSMIFCTPANEDDYVTAVCAKSNTLQKIEDIEDCEIIDRPIRLADVLNLPDSFTDKYSNKENKELLWKLCANWNLLQDDLTLQSQETIDFLYSLLNKEE